MKAVNDMIDLHTHILPGIDDGASNAEESLEMLRESACQGVELCVATSHIHPVNSDDIQCFLKKRETAYGELIKACEGHTVPEIVLGAEVHMDRDISDVEGINQLCMGDTDYMLVEFPFMTYPGAGCAEWLYNLNLKGIIPIIAHIDRYTYRDELIDNISGIRLIYQVNNIRMSDMSGRRFIKKLLSTGYMVVMSSDMHNNGIRNCDMKKSYDTAKKKMPRFADALYVANADILFDRI